MLIPKDVLAGKKKAPAVLCLHGTDNVIGHGTVVGLGKKANRGYALELAQRGYVTLAPNYPLLARYQPDLKKLGWESGTLKAVWDNKRGLDLLASLPYVDHSRGFGIIGHSLGGHNSVFTAVFDDRLKVIVSSCGLDSFLDYYEGAPKNWDPEKGWCQTRYMRKLADYKGRLADIPFDFHELIGALAPRATCSSFVQSADEGLELSARTAWTASPPPPDRSSSCTATRIACASSIPTASTTFRRHCAKRLTSSSTRYLRGSSGLHGHANR